MGRIMAVDFGAKTAGVALSDPGKSIASPYETIVRDREGKIRATYRRLIDIAASEDVERIIVGYPLNMDGSVSERAEKSRAFSEELLRRLIMEGLGNVEVELWDERLTTFGADEVLEEAGVAAGERKQYIDKIAAALILEDWLKNGKK